MKASHGNESEKGWKCELNVVQKMLVGAGLLSVYSVLQCITVYYYTV